MNLTIKIRTQIREWLLNGVTFKEVQERLSWLDISVTFKEIKNIAYSRE